MKKRTAKILILIAAIVIVCGYMVYRLHFPCTGSRSGHVLDGVTGKPIQGVVVCYFWVFSPVMGGDRYAANYETITDKDGKYFIPSQRAVCPNILLYGPLQREKVLIYKDGYAAYVVFHTDDPQIGRSFGYLHEKQPYRKKNNIAKLYPFKEGESHEKHVDWIGGWTLSPQKNELLLKELEPEKTRAYK
jgi:hypothetical protein